MKMKTHSVRFHVNSVCMVDLQIQGENIVQKFKSTGSDHDYNIPNNIELFWSHTKQKEN